MSYKQKIVCTFFLFILLLFGTAYYIGLRWPKAEGKKLLLHFKKIPKHDVFLSEAAGDIIFGLFFSGIGEHSLGVIKFNEFTQI